MKNIIDLLTDLNKQNRNKLKLKRTKNNGFENLKNAELKFEFENCMKVKFNPRKHFKLSSLGFKTIYQLDNLGKRRWSEYFNSGGMVYIISYSTKLPLYKRILFDRKIKKFIGKDVPLPLKPKPIRRRYVKGGRNTKVLGFNYYMITDKKLMPKHRRLLLSRSEHYIGIIEDEQTRNGAEKLDYDVLYLDPNLTDLEIVEQWNLFYLKYGYRFSEFENQWFKLYGKEDYGINKVEDAMLPETDSQTITFNIKDIFKPFSSNLG